GTVVLEVKDNGIGMAEDERRRIFERFGRGVPVRHYGGLGLGLYLVRRLVEAHGRRISVESRPGRGSTFTVELPVEEDSGAAG
ncbi:MAG TPA: sensor histidine kinase, partial [Archangium sp.]|nr:sensor histidine kinase [Archangium sp.]